MAAAPLLRPQPTICQMCMHVQEACILVPSTAYQDRIDQVIADIPVKSANGTSADQFGRGDDYVELILLPAAAPEESAYGCDAACNGSVVGFFSYDFKCVFISDVYGDHQD
jgi:hypothetical protein